MERYPSIKTLMQIKDVTKDDARQIRDIMRGHQAVPCTGCGRINDIGSADAYPANVCPTSHDGKHHYSRMGAINTILHTCGVEYTGAGHNAKSPAILYCNTGDTYGVTVLRINGRYRVGTWGDIVERGNYD